MRTGVFRQRGQRRQFAEMIAAKRRQNAALQAGQSPRRINTLRIVDEQLPFVGILAAADRSTQKLPEIGGTTIVWHATSHGGHDERAKVRPIARFVDANDPHKKYQVRKTLPAAGAFGTLYLGLRTWEGDRVM